MLKYEYKNSIAMTEEKVKVNVFRSNRIYLRRCVGCDDDAQNAVIIFFSHSDSQAWPLLTARFTASTLPFLLHNFFFHLFFSITLSLSIARHYGYGRLPLHWYLALLFAICYCGDCHCVSSFVPSFVPRNVLLGEITKMSFAFMFYRVRLAKLHGQQNKCAI